jgi:glutamyl-tRNA reductase
MHLLALGLNHDSAPIAIRERVSVTAERLTDALKDVTTTNKVEEVTILSTCNRTEIYCHQQDDSAEQIIAWLCGFQEMPKSDLLPYLYRYPDDQAVRHAFRVAAGLDSMVLGEPQILGQMKEAFAIAHKSGVTGKILNRLFQQTFSVAKQVRTDTAIGSSAVSVAFAAVSLAKQIFTNLSKQTVLMIGAGETIELTARHLKDNGANHLIVANRTVERARQLAANYDAEAISLDELPARLSDGDIVISSTASTLPPTRRPSSGVIQKACPPTAYLVLAESKSPDWEVKVFPLTHHGMFLAREGGTAEFQELHVSHKVPGYWPTLLRWLDDRY